MAPGLHQVSAGSDRRMPYPMVLRSIPKSQELSQVCFPRTLPSILPFGNFSFSHSRGAFWTKGVLHSPISLQEDQEARGAWPWHIVMSPSREVV